MTLRSRFRASLPADTTEAWIAEADTISVPRIDEAGAQPRPSTLGVSYVEQEYHARADEQELAWPAIGEAAARPFQTEARGLDRQTAAVERLLTDKETEVREARADYQHAARVLGSLVRREPGGKLRYWLCWPVLWFGDTAGIWSAAITNGDIPYVAFGQACSAGLAAACAGLVGSELRDIRMARARQRDPDSLSKDEQRYQHLFTAGAGGLGIVKLIGGLSLLVVALLAVGICALRSSIEGDASGLTFGLLAAATAIGSGLLGYAASDQVADLLANYRKRVVWAEKDFLTLAASKQLRRRAAAEETARSIHAEHKLLGQAAARCMEFLAARVQRRNPQVFGHGVPTGEQSGIIGRRARRGSAA